jgi:hypothetical protein
MRDQMKVRPANATYQRPNDTSDAGADQSTACAPETVDPTLSAA